MTEGYNSMERAIDDMNLEEDFWPEIASYVDSVLAQQLKTVGELLDYDLVRAESDEVSSFTVVSLINATVLSISKLNINSNLWLTCSQSHTYVLSDVRKCQRLGRIDSCIT